MKKNGKESRINENGKKRGEIKPQQEAIKRPSSPPPGPGNPEKKN